MRVQTFEYPCFRCRDKIICNQHTGSVLGTVGKIAYCFDLNIPYIQHNVQNFSSIYIWDIVCRKRNRNLRVIFNL
jgi:hypothetical protein